MNAPPDEPGEPSRSPRSRRGGILGGDGPPVAGAVGTTLAVKLASLPTGPGVYLFKDGRGRVLYVGKARGLRARVSSYFRGGDGRLQIRFLVERVRDLECLVTRNEKEALILENNLIKQYRPRYNVRLTDDKSYVSVKITRQDAWPRVVVTRRIARDGAQYFGPFHSASSVRETLDVIRRVFPLRTCSDGTFRHRSRPCLEYQIKRCLAPCCLDVDRGEYEEHLRSAALLLEGKDSQLVRALTTRMQAASEELRFEAAARLRDQIRAIERTGQAQQVVVHGGGDRDVIGFYREGGFLEIQLLMVRAGKLTANRSFGLSDWELPDAEVIGDLLGRYYQGDQFVPDEVLLPCAVEDATARADLLGERLGRRVHIVVPVRGERRRLVELANANARQAFLARRQAADRFAASAEELRQRLGLRNAPRAIQCVDISTFQGRETVGSVVTLIDGRPEKSRYRRFHLKTVVGTDDFASMREVVGRHLRRCVSDSALPDLLVIDGGRGQLAVAVAVRDDLGLHDLDVVSLAKMRVRSDALAAEIERVEERVFLVGRKNPVVLPRNSNALFLLQRARDEAHRFAVTFHKEVRSRARLTSSLDAISGVGPTRRRLLLRHFGSLARIRAAGLEELAQVPGIDRTMAERIRAAIGGREERDEA